MAILDATLKAIELQQLVGTEPHQNGLKVIAVIPAPTDEALFGRFVLAIRDETPTDKSCDKFSEIAEIIDATNFEVAILYQGKSTVLKAGLLGGLKWAWYK